MYLDTPITRKEMYLSAIAGNASEVPEYPITREEKYLAAILENGGGGGGGGTTNYNALSNKPQINGVTLSGNKTAADLGLVASESGKGLSTNDYTTTEKNKLSGIESGAEANVIESISVNGIDAPIVDKTAVLTVSYNDLTNKPTDVTDAQITQAVASAWDAVFEEGGG